MSKQIGPVLARTFREICEESNKRAKADHSKISPEEISQIEQLLRKVDSKNFQLEKELRKIFELFDDKME